MNANYDNQNNHDHDNSNLYKEYTPNFITMDVDDVIEEKKKKERKTAKKFGVLLGSAATFGVVSAGVFSLTVSLLGTGTNFTEGNQTADIAATTVNTTTSTVSSDVSTIAENVMPAMVSITNMSVQEVQSLFGQSFNQEQVSAGSGVIIGNNDEELLILTNNHVIEDTNELTITFNDGESVQGTVKGTDPAKDLAIVAIPVETIGDETMNSIKVATLGDSDTLAVGEPVVAIGNALGYGQSVTTGIVSATGRTLDGIDGELIQTDTAINGGNSGGALVNMNGEVIGINVAKIGSTGVEGMGYAIPVTGASETIDTLMNRETRSLVSEAEKGYIGIQGVSVTAESAQMYAMPEGVYISEIIEDGAAEKAGIMKGSIITELDGVSVTSIEGLVDSLGYYAQGETVKITVSVPTSNGEYEEKTLDITLQDAQ